MNKKRFYTGLAIALAGVLLFSLWDLQLLPACLVVGGCAYTGGSVTDEAKEVRHE